MEAFARQREEDIDPLGYSQVDPSSFVVLEKTVQGSLEDKSIAAGSIIDWSNDRGIYGLSPVPKLKIISIEHEHRFKQHISKPFNDALYSAFHIGSWMKNLAFNQNRGFFHVRPKDREDIETFLFSTGYGMVAWSFCRTTSLTRGIFLGWGTRWQDLGYRLFPYNDSVSHPLLLGLVCAQWVIFEADRSIYRQLNVLDGVEAATGYHSTQYVVMTRHGSHDQQPEDLSELSKRLADVSITIAQATGYIKIAKRVIQSLVDDPWKLRQVQAPVWDDVAQVVRCVLAEVTEEETWDDAKQIRMANQMTVVSYGARLRFTIRHKLMLPRRSSTSSPEKTRPPALSSPRRPSETVPR